MCKYYTCTKKKKKNGENAREKLLTLGPGPIHCNPLSMLNYLYC